MFEVPYQKTGNASTSGPRVKDLKYPIISRLGPLQQLLSFGRIRERTSMFSLSNGSASAQPPSPAPSVHGSLEVSTIISCDNEDAQTQTAMNDKTPPPLPYTLFNRKLSDGVAIFATSTGAFVKNEPQKPGPRRRCFNLVRGEDSPATSIMSVHIQSAINGTQLDQRQVPKNTRVGTLLREYVSRTTALRVVCNNVLVKFSQTLDAITDDEIVTLGLVREAPLPYPRSDYLLRVFIADERHRTAVHVAKYDLLLPKVCSRFRRVLPHLVRRVANHGASRFARRLACDFPPAVQRRRLLENAHRRSYVYAGDTLYEGLDVVDVVLLQSATGHLTLHADWQGSKVDKPTVSAARAMRRVARSRQP